MADTVCVVCGGAGDEHKSHCAEIRNLRTDYTQQTPVEDIPLANLQRLGEFAVSFLTNYGGLSSWLWAAVHDPDGVATSFKLADKYAEHEDDMAHTIPNLDIKLEQVEVKASPAPFPAVLCNENDLNAAVEKLKQLKKLTRHEVSHSKGAKEQIAQLFEEIEALLKVGD